MGAEDKKFREAEELEDNVEEVADSVASLIRGNQNLTAEEFKELIEDEKIAWEKIDKIEKVLENLSSEQRHSSEDLLEKIDSILDKTSENDSFWTKIESHAESGQELSKMSSKVEGAIKKLSELSEEILNISKLGLILSREILEEGKIIEDLNEAEETLLSDLYRSVDENSGSDLMEVVEPIVVSQESDIKEQFAIIESEKKTAEKVTKEILEVKKRAEKLYEDSKIAVSFSNSIVPQYKVKEAKTAQKNLENSVENFEEALSNLEKIEWQKLEDEEESIRKEEFRLENSLKSSGQISDSLKPIEYRLKGDSVDPRELEYPKNGFWYPARGHDKSVKEQLIPLLRQQEQVAFKPPGSSETKFIPAKKAEKEYRKLVKAHQESSVVIRPESTVQKFKFITKGFSGSLDWWIVFKDRDSIQFACFRLKKGSEEIDKMNWAKAKV